MSEVVDEALDLVNRCGWRYALTYLIHHRVSQEVIQRLLSGACARRLQPSGSREYRRIRTWKGASDDDMAMLFDSLWQRRVAAGCAIGRASLPAAACGTLAEQEQAGRATASPTCLHEPQ